MCVHPIYGYDNLDRPIEIAKYQHELDTCDYYDLTNPIEARHGDLLVMQLNIRGLFGKMSNLKNLINNASHGKKIDVILLCETWQNKNSPSISLPGYEYVYKIRKHKIGGGVGIFVSDRIRYTEVKLSANYESIEHVVINIKTKHGNESITICSLYRPPNTNDTKFVEEYKNLLLDLYKTSTSKKLILGMDHNLDFLKHSLHKRTHDFIELNLDNSLIPSITRPTRITKSSATLIDNIIVSQSLITKSESRIIIDDISDHLPSIVKFKETLQNIRSSKTITSRNVNEKTVQKISDTLSRVNWSNVITENVDDSFESFHDLLQKTVNEHAPIVTRKLSRKNFRREPWIDPSLLRSINIQKKLYAKAIKSNVSNQDITKYKNYKKILDKLKRQAKINYYHTKCKEFKCNSKKLWELINCTIGKLSDKSSAINYIKTDQMEIINEKAIANEFGKYFSSVGREYADKVKTPKQNIIYYINKITHNPNSIYFYHTTETEVRNIINNLPNKTSSGFDNISNILLKRISPAIIKPLTLIFNNSLNQGVFPNKMKLSETCPLHKGKEIFYTTNYRPISLLLTISKLLEKIVYKRTYQFLTQTNQFYHSQYGFRRSHSCEDAVSELMGEVLKNRENAKFTAALYLDLSKAFDTLEPTVLYHKLEKYGIRGICLNWFRSYLTNRKLRVKCKLTNGTEYSDWYDVEYGTPQGSCLGPLLFLIFCNDLYKNLEYLECLQFADDTTLYYGHKNKNFLLYCLEHDLEVISDWFRANKLTLNISKTVFMIFHPKGKKMTEKIRFENDMISNMRETKFLGVWLNDNISWESHIRQLILKLKRNLMLLKRSKNFLNQKALKLVYYGHFHSHLKYGILLWGSMLSQNQTNRLQKLQDQAIQLLHRLKPVHTIYNDLKIPKLHQMIKIEQLKFAYRLINNLLPINLMKLVKTDHKGSNLIKTHQYQTRFKAELNLPLTKSRHYRNSFLHQSTRVFSTLPTKVKNEITLESFKRSIKNHI